MTQNYAKTGGGLVAALAGIVLWFCSGVIRAGTGLNQRRG